MSGAPTPVLLPDFAGRPVAVLGLARSGLSAARALGASGALVAAWDDDPERRRIAAAEGVPVCDLGDADWSRLRTLVISPGIPHTHPRPHPVAAAARTAGAALIGDIELLLRARPEAAYVGITGTNGKSTTTALLGHLLRAAGQRIEVGGNLGTPALDLAALGAEGTYVLELSSYQLEITWARAFDAVALVNVSPDHLDRHGGMDGYLAAKRRIFALAKDGAVAVIGADDPHGRAIAADLEAERRLRITTVSGEDPEAEVSFAGGALVDRRDGDGAAPVALAAMASLPGSHNWQNAATAYALARRLGADRPILVDALASFPGLAHRQERLATIDGVLYVNDSKATNADAAARALACYDSIYWIAGGRPKEDGIGALAPFFPRIRHAYLIGEAASAFADTLQGRVPFNLSGDLAQALDQARRDAGRGGVVLLSPAAASFDQFKSFEDRGDTFRRLVANLPGARS